ncbi:MAG: pilus assembly protein PilM [Phycisphaerae bacterium]|nr:pilus assembly protein PilM [Phycisphaerae bacterium]
MALSMFSSHASPIVADFGSSSVKLLQLSSGEKPVAVAAAELGLPDAIRSATIERKFEFYAAEIPKLLREHGFKGKRVVCCPPSGQMLVQHMQVAGNDPYAATVHIREQLQGQLGIPMHNIVVRSVVVGETQREGQTKAEHIVFAIARDDVMRYVDFFRKMKMQIVGVHNELQSLIYAFDHINQRAADAEVATLYVDLGWGSTKVVIGHGKEIVFAKSIALGGRHFDNLVAQAFKCDAVAARARRLTEDLLPLRQAPAPTAAAVRNQAVEEGGLAILRAGKAMAESDERIASRTETTPDSLQQLDAMHASMAVEGGRRVGEAHPTVAQGIPVGAGPMRTKVDFSELLESLSDELSMCARYHSACFGTRNIERVIFLGGEARQIGLCQFLAQGLHLPAKAGDPLARLLGPTPPAGLPDPDQPHPSWAVACGLCSAPTDL